MEVIFCQALEAHAVDLAGGVERHLVEDDDLFGRLVADAVEAPLGSGRSRFERLFEQFGALAQAGVEPSANAAWLLGRQDQRQTAPSAQDGGVLCIGPQA